MKNTGNNASFLTFFKFQKTNFREIPMFKIQKMKLVGYMKYQYFSMNPF
jgi:hypothetical protein